MVHIAFPLRMKKGGKVNDADMNNFNFVFDHVNELLTDPKNRDATRDPNLYGTPNLSDNASYVDPNSINSNPVIPTRIIEIVK